MNYTPLLLEPETPPSWAVFLIFYDLRERRDTRVRFRPQLKARRHSLWSRSPLAVSPAGSTWLRVSSPDGSSASFSRAVNAESPFRGFHTFRRDLVDDVRTTFEQENNAAIFIPILRDTNAS